MESDMERVRVYRLANGRCEELVDHERTLPNINDVDLNKDPRRRWGFVAGSGLLEPFANAGIRWIVAAGETIGGRPWVVYNTRPESFTTTGDSSDMYVWTDRRWALAASTKHRGDSWLAATSSVAFDGVILVEHSLAPGRQTDQPKLRMTAWKTTGTMRSWPINLPTYDQTAPRLRAVMSFEQDRSLLVGWSWQSRTIFVVRWQPDTLASSLEQLPLPELDPFIEFCPLPSALTLSDIHVNILSENSFELLGKNMTRFHFTYDGQTWRQSKPARSLVVNSLAVMFPQHDGQILFGPLVSRQQPMLAAFIGGGSSYVLYEGAITQSCYTDVDIHELPE